MELHRLGMLDQIATRYTGQLRLGVSRRENLGVPLPPVISTLVWKPMSAAWSSEPLRCQDGSI